MLETKPVWTWVPMWCELTGTTQLSLPNVDSPLTCPSVERKCYWYESWSCGEEAEKFGDKRSEWLKDQC